MKNDHDELNSVSSRYLPDREMEEPLARLFRRLQRLLRMNPYKWSALTGDYLDWTIKDKDKEKEKVKRATRYGNIRDTFFNKTRLTHPMFLEGLSIYQFKECKIRYECTHENGEVYIVEEIVQIKNCKSSPHYVEPEESSDDKPKS